MRLADRDHEVQNRSVRKQFKGRLRKPIHKRVSAGLMEDLTNQKKEFNFDMVTKKIYIEDQLKNGDQESGRLNEAAIVLTRA